MSAAPPVSSDLPHRDGHRLILAQAIVGEIVAIENYARMIPLARTDAEKLLLLDEATHERAHVRVLHGVGKLLGLPPVEDVGSDPYWARVRGAMEELASGGQLTTMRFVQDVVLEAYAVTLYRAVLPHVEPTLRRALSAIADDEQRHLAAGVAVFADALARDRDRAVDALAFGHARVARVLAEWIAPTACRPLCGACGAMSGACGKALLEEMKLDTRRLAAEFADVYGGALRGAGLGPAEALRYIAELIP